MEPAAADTLYRKVPVDARTGRLADANTPPEAQKTIIALDLPPQAAPWARSKGITLLTDLTSTSTGINTDADRPQSALSMINPPANALFRYVPSVSGEAQRLRLEAGIRAGGSGLREVTLWVDGQLVARLTQPPYQAWWPLSIGFHEAWAEGLTQDGLRIASDRVGFEVKGDSP
jgi:hypothetical protein